MLGDQEVDAETADQLTERRNEGGGAGDDRDPATFYPNADAYPAGGGTLPPTGELGEPAPTDALHPDEEHRDGDDQIETPDEARPRHP